MKIKVNLFKEKNFWRGLFQLFFRFSFGYFLVLWLVDLILPGFVTNWFNPIWFLIIAIISGIIATIE
jgi:hypothetical protein